MSAIDGLGNDAFELFKSSGFIGSFGAVWHCNQDCVSDMMTCSTTGCGNNMSTNSCN